MVKRPKHPEKDIEKAIQFAEKNGWRYKDSGKSAHAWGRLLCPLSERDGCSMSIWSTPRNSNVHAEQIKKRVESCQHLKEKGKP